MRPGTALCIALLLAALAPGLAADPDAYSLVKTGRADEALRILNARIEKNPNDAEAHNLLCRVHFQLQHWDESVHAGEKAVALESQKAEYHQWLARAYGEKADVSGTYGAFRLVSKVKAEFEKAVALDPDGKNLSARADLAEFYSEAPSIMGGDKTKARQLAEFVSKSDPALGHSMFGRLEEKQGKKDRAEQEYKAAIESSGNLAHYWINLASFYRRSGRLDEMEAAVSKALTARIPEGITLFDGASLLREAGRNPSGAAQMLRKYLSSNDPVEDGPTFDAHYQLGLLLEKQGDSKGAAGEYRAALALASQYRPAQDALNKLPK